MHVSIRLVGFFGAFGALATAAQAQELSIGSDWAGVLRDLDAPVAAPTSPYDMASFSSRLSIIAAPNANDPSAGEAIAASRGQAAPVDNLILRYDAKNVSLFGGRMQRRLDSGRVWGDAYSGWGLGGNLDLGNRGLGQHSVSAGSFRLSSDGPGHAGAVNNLGRLQIPGAPDIADEQSGFAIEFDGVGVGGAAGFGYHVDFAYGDLEVGEGSRDFWRAGIDLQFGNWNAGASFTEQELAVSEDDQASGRVMTFSAGYSLDSGLGINLGYTLNREAEGQNNGLDVLLKYVRDF